MVRVYTDISIFLFFYLDPSKMKKEHNTPFSLFYLKEEQEAQEGL